MGAALYLSAPAAIRWDPVVRAFYQRLCAAGKAKKVALTARMRRLLTMLNAMVKPRSPWTTKIDYAKRRIDTGVDVRHTRRQLSGHLVSGHDRN